MPYHIEHVGNVWIVKDYKGKVYGKHKTKAKAQDQIYAINMNEKRKRK